MDLLLFDVKEDPYAYINYFISLINDVLGGDCNANAVPLPFFQKKNFQT